AHDRRGRARPAQRRPDDHDPRRPVGEGADLHLGRRRQLHDPDPGELMTATLTRPTTDARITGGKSDVIHTTVTMDPSPIAHLSPQQIEDLGRELDEIRTDVMDSLGEDDARYIRRVITVQRYLEMGSRAVLLFSGNPIAWVAGTAGLSVAKIL